jgi:hypothetical protein
VNTITFRAGMLWQKSKRTTAPVPVPCMSGAFTMAAEVHEQTRKALWQAMADFVHLHGGWVVSPPSNRYLRLECPQGSALPTQLAKAGFPLRHAGMTTRIGKGFCKVDILELDLSEK